MGIIPLDLLLSDIERIARAIPGPVALDFEGATSVDPPGVRRNFAPVLETGIVGFNFAGQVIGGEGLHAVADQVAWMGSLRRAPWIRI